MNFKSILEIQPSFLTKFDCGIEPLNFYLKRFAKKNDKLGIGRTFVLTSKTQVLGFYTVSMAQISFESLPADSHNQLPRYPIPAVRIGRLAVDLKNQGNGYGETLLMNALSRVKRVSNEIAVFAVIVDAKNAKAKKFYTKFGFLPYKDSELSLFLPIKTLND